MRRKAEEEEVDAPAAVNSATMSPKERETAFLKDLDEATGKARAEATGPLALRAPLNCRVAGTCLRGQDWHHLYQMHSFAGDGSTRCPHQQSIPVLSNPDPVHELNLNPQPRPRPRPQT